MRGVAGRRGLRPGVARTARGPRGAALRRARPERVRGERTVPERRYHRWARASGREVGRGRHPARGTLKGYAAAARGEAASLDAQMPVELEPLVEPPFHALEVQPAITFTYGGLRTDPDGRVLDPHGG